MNMPQDVTLGFITVPNQSLADTIASQLLQDRLVACVNVLDGLKSLYWWEGKIEDAREVLLIIKTISAKHDAIIARVKELHAYTVPEIIFIPLAAGDAGYLDWVVASVHS